MCEWLECEYSHMVRNELRYKSRCLCRHILQVHSHHIWAALVDQLLAYRTLADLLVQETSSQHLTKTVITEADFNSFKTNPCWFSTKECLNRQNVCVCVSDSLLTVLMLGWVYFGHTGNPELLPALVYNSSLQHWVSFLLSSSSAGCAVAQVSCLGNSKFNTKRCEDLYHSPFHSGHCTFQSTAVFHALL